jgi:hypothetical protein
MYLIVLVIYTCIFYFYAVPYAIVILIKFLILGMSNVYMYECLYVCTYVCMQVRMYVHTYLLMYKRMYVSS